MVDAAEVSDLEKGGRADQSHPDSYLPGPRKAWMPGEQPPSPLVPGTHSTEELGRVWGWLQNQHHSITNKNKVTPNREEKMPHLKAFLLLL